MTTAKARTRRPINPQTVLIIFAVMLLAGGTTALKSTYLDPRDALTDGTPGTFTLERCERVDAPRSGPDTFCYGTFRADDGSAVLRDHKLDDDHDVEGMEPGESFEARAIVNEFGPDQVVRADDTGETNLTMRGIGCAGIILLGCTLAGFAARNRMAPGTARSRLGVALGVAATLSALAWILGISMGSGFWA